MYSHSKCLGRRAGSHHSRLPSTYPPPRLFDNKPAYVANMGAMVKRDRNHASIILWSFCNEVGCEARPELARQPNEPGLPEVDEAGGPAFYDVAHRL